MSFGKRLKEARMKKQISQEMLGKAVSVSRETISKYESDKRMPPLHVAIDLASILDVSLLDLTELSHRNYLDLTSLDENTRNTIEFILLKNMKKRK